MSPSHEPLLLEVCRALSEHDLATLQILLAPDIACHLPPSEGGCRGFDELIRLWRSVSQRGRGGLELELEAVLGGDRYAVALCRSRVDGGPRPLEEQVLAVVRIDEGRVAEGWLYRDAAGAPPRPRTAV